MSEIPDRLRCVYSARLEERDGAYVFEVPRTELEQGGVERGEAYHVGVVAPAPSQSSSAADTGVEHESRGGSGGDDHQPPPVEEGDVREVTIETLGEQGDGIAKLERGYVVIVPGTRPNDEVLVEITNATPSVGFAQVQSEPEEEDEEEAAAEGGSGPEPPPDDALTERDTL